MLRYYFVCYAYFRILNSGGIRMKLGVVDVGGGMRGIYAAGVLDYCLSAGIRFDCCVGVSAGSANVASYLAGQEGRNYLFHHKYSFRREYMSLGGLLRGRGYVNLPYIYGTLSNSGGENPLNYANIRDNPAQLFVVATEAGSGRAVYFTKADLRQDDYRIFMASSCLPGANPPFELDRVRYYDGALSDPVPIEKAFQEGCDRVVLLLTKPKDVPRAPGKDPMIARLIQRRWPGAAEGLRQRAARYNAGVEAARRYAAEGKALIVAPADTQGVDTLTRDRDALDRLYHMGRQDGQAIADWLGG